MCSFCVFQSLQLDIESRGKALSSLLRLCQHLCENPSSGVGATGDCISSSSTVVSSSSSSVPPRRGARALKLAQRLEKRWQILYLKNLEWILHLEKSTAVSILLLFPSLCRRRRRRPERPKKTKTATHAVSAGRVLLCAKRPLFFSADYFSLLANGRGAPVSFTLWPPMYFALYGLEMDVWNTLFTLLGSTLVICAAKFISTVLFERFRSAAEWPRRHYGFFVRRVSIGNARRVVPN